ncbi:hypothetical protein BX666DRAFT_1937901 [Dichotomocladium elegans]|nr:hypothetical protein BX666DRAFT_1937901 [Dichotomocladium elegans]
MESDRMDTDAAPGGVVHSNTPQLLSSSPPPPAAVKIRKKPGRKPNPASPALRKAQNRAAQRAFRERKELHLKELESAMKQVRQERDQLASTNDQLRAENDTLKSENWYLKGIVLSLQLVCLQHNLTVPPHGPYINEQSLSILAQSIPEPIATYFDVNSKSKVPTFSKITSHARQPNRCSVQPTTNASLHDHPNETSSSPPRPTTSPLPTSTVPERKTCAHKDDEHENQRDSNPSLPRPMKENSITSNLAAIQALRLRLRLQSACVRMTSLPFALQPTLLQLTVPHDPRIDLIPTPHMRDRMILFRDQFSLDDCFRCLLNHSVFHGGDPAIAANWQLPPEFFEKYWFLTIDWSLHRVTNQWRRMQGLEEVPTHASDMTLVAQASDVSSFLGLDFVGLRKSTTPIAAVRPQSSADDDLPYPASITSTNSSASNDQEMFTNAPIQLTNGYWGHPQKRLATESSHGNGSLLYTI